MRQFLVVAFNLSIQLTINFQKAAGQQSNLLELDPRHLVEHGWSVCYRQNIVNIQIKVRIRFFSYVASGHGFIEPKHIIVHMPDVACDDFSFAIFSCDHRGVVANYMNIALMVWSAMRQSTIIANDSTAVMRIYLRFALYYKGIFWQNYSDLLLQLMFVCDTKIMSIALSYNLCSVIRSAFTIFMLATALTSCAQQEPATIEYRSNRSTGHQSQADDMRNSEQQHHSDTDDTINRHKEVNVKEHSGNESVEYLESGHDRQGAQFADSMLHPIENKSSSIGSHSGKNKKNELDELSTENATKSRPKIELIEERMEWLDKKRSSEAKLAMPVKGGKITNTFGRSDKRFNDGVAIALPEGREVVAAADGSVVYVGQELLEYGNMVIIEHKGDMITSYSRMKSSTVKAGDKVKKGQLIGYVGKHSTGKSTEAQLLFSVRISGVAVDPLQYVSE